jgi:gluconate 2-dehydrogenase gamma chain
MTSHPPTVEPVIALTFFNDFEARTVEAIAERIIPGEDADAGATEAGVVYYIDRAVSGFSTGLQRLYRVGLGALDAYCRSRHGASFVALGKDSQDDVVRRFLGPETPTGEAVRPAGEDDYDFAGGPERKKPGEAPAVLERLFAVIREHAIEGLFCDPIYGGNRDGVGWRLVGFPGVHWGYTAEQMKEGFDGRRLPIRTLSDLRRSLADLPENTMFRQSDRA